MGIPIARITKYKRLRNTRILREYAHSAAACFTIIKGGSIMKNWKPQDTIALVLLVGCLALLALGRDGTITNILAGIALTYGISKAGVKLIKK